MKIIVLLLLGSILVFGADVVEVGEKFKNSTKCKACHIHLVKDWQQSWHSKSHYKRDEYFKATVDYVTRKTRRSVNSVKVGCAKCHNPRISVTNVNEMYDVAAVLNLDIKPEVKKATESDILSEGINCVVCHNIDEIHSDKNKYGIDRITWTQAGLMSGPYNNTASPYHKVEYRDFMEKNSDRICLICHSSDKAVKGLVFANMQKEYKKDKKGRKNQKGCVNCHMGEKKMGIAATLRIDNGQPRRREIRSHKFAGGHMEQMWRDALNLKVFKRGRFIAVSILNPQPHNIPSGFGSRELILEVAYKNGFKTIDTKSISLTTHYKSKWGKPTIAHLAVKSTKDLSIPAYGKKVFNFKKNPKASGVEVKLYYRLVNDEVRSILKLKDKIWSKKMLIASKRLVF